MQQTRLGTMRPTLSILVRFSWIGASCAASFPGHIIRITIPLTLSVRDKRHALTSKWRACIQSSLLALEDMRACPVRTLDWGQTMLI